MSAMILARTAWLCPLLMLACGNAPVGGALPEPLSPEAGPDRLEVQVLVYNRIRPSREGAPIPGATVTLAFGAEHRVATADADGLAVFEGIDLDALTSAIATAEGRAFQSRSGANIRKRLHDYGSPTLLLLRGGCVDPGQIGCGYPSDELVTLGGSATHHAGALQLLVTASVPGFEQGSVNPSAWSIQVPRGQPFHLFALGWGYATEAPPVAEADLWNWGTQTAAFDADVDALQSDVAGDVIDFATGSEAREAEGRFRLPDHELLRQEGQGFMTVRTWDIRDEGLLGIAQSWRDADSRYGHFRAKWIDTPGFEVVTKYEVARPETFDHRSDYSSWIFVDGPPTNDPDFVPGFLSPPDLVRGTRSVHVERQPDRYELTPRDGLGFGA